MKVETYEVISVDEQNGAVVNEVVSEEALAIIGTLGLDGQQSLVSERQVENGDAIVTRNPYRQMTAEEFNIFAALLPRREKLKEYNDGPIPLRVLQVAAHAVDHFDEVEVWCPEDPSTPDPLLVGRKGEQSWSRESYILARWGDVLEPMDALRARARTIILTRMRAEIAKMRAKISTVEAGLEPNLDSFLLGTKGANPAEFLGSLSFTS